MFEEVNDIYYPGFYTWIKAAHPLCALECSNCGLIYPLSVFPCPNRPCLKAYSPFVEWREYADSVATELVRFVRLQQFDNVLEHQLDSGR